MNTSQPKKSLSRRDVYWLGGIALVAIVGFTIGARYYRGAQEARRAEEVAKQPAPPPSVLVRPHSHSLGPANAKVTIVEFLDPECESCREMYPAVKHLLQEYAGKVRLVVRIMPFHKNSLYAASALEAAAEQGRYWDFLEVLFVNQPRWGSHHDPKPELIPELARQIGLDMEAFNRSHNNPAHRTRLEMDREDGKSLGVNGTPTFFVNGRPLERLGYEPLKALIDEELAK
jgi:protein-disulfide isomerase